VKTIFRLFGLSFALGGWALAALCLHVIRTPNPNDPKESRLVVIPKARLGIIDTYVDARNWTLADVAEHKALIWRVVDAGKSDDLKYLSDPSSGEDMQTQLMDILTGGRTSRPSHMPATGTSYHHRNKPDTASSFSESALDNLDLGKLLDFPVSF